MKYSTTRNLINNAGFFILSGIIMLSPVIGNIFNQWDGVFPVFLISTVCATILLTQVWLRSTNHTPVKITTTDIGFTLYLTYGVLRLNIFKETFDPITLCEWSGLTAIYISTRWGKPKFVTWLLYALLVGGIIQALIGLCQFAGILESNNTTFKITGSFMNPEPYGGFLALSTIVCLSTWKKETYTWTGFHLLLPCILLLLTTTLILSDSRAAWLAVFVSSCFLFIKRNTPYHHWHMKLVVGLLATLLVVALYYYKKPSADVRLLTWNSSSLMFLDKPILGHGIGSFPANYMLYQAQFLNEHPGEEWEIIADNNITAFNEFIHLACEQGIIGLLLFLGLFISAFSDTQSTKHGQTAQVCLVALITFAFFSYPASIYPIKLCFPLLLGILGQKSKVVTRFNPSPKAYILPTLIISTSIYFNMRVYLIYQKAYTTLEKHAYNEIKLLRHERINETLGVKKQLYTLAPTSSLSCDIGMIHLYKHERDSAEYYFKQAKEMTPNHVLPFYGLWLIAKTKTKKNNVSN